MTNIAMKDTNLTWVEAIRLAIKCGADNVRDARQMLTDNGYVRIGTDCHETTPSNFGEYEAIQLLGEDEVVELNAISERTGSAMSPCGCIMHSDRTYEPCKYHTYCLDLPIESTQPMEA